MSDLARVWGVEPSEAFNVTADIPFHEAGLLKLNCDKAMLELRWEPTLVYAECVELTGSWYRDVLRHSADAGELTATHIGRYVELAGERRRSWAG